MKVQEHYFGEKKSARAVKMTHFNMAFNSHNKIISGSDRQSQLITPEHIRMSPANQFPNRNILISSCIVFSDLIQRADYNKHKKSIRSETTRKDHHLSVLVAMVNSNGENI